MSNSTVTHGHILFQTLSLYSWSRRTANLHQNHKLQPFTTFKEGKRSEEATSRRLSLLYHKSLPELLRWTQFDSHRSSWDTLMEDKLSNLSFNLSLSANDFSDIRGKVLKSLRWSDQEVINLHAPPIPSRLFWDFLAPFPPEFTFLKVPIFSQPFSWLE